MFQFLRKFLSSKRNMCEKMQKEKKVKIMGRSRSVETGTVVSSRIQDTEGSMWINVSS